MYQFKEIYTIDFTKVKHYRSDKYAKDIKIEIVMGESRFEL